MKNTTRGTFAIQSQQKTQTIPHKRREAIRWHYCESTPCAVSKDKWDTKEDTDKSLKHALYVLWYAKRHLSAKSNVEY